MSIRGYLVDTNIAIAILAKEQIVMDFVEQAKNDKMSIFFSVITECEVYSGLKSEFQLRGVKLFNSRRCLDVNSKIARIAGDIRREQRVKGRKLKTPDAIIIATASSIN
ncbi:PIN domain-containing protein [Paenibacillus oryzisoli]|uniref:type II toxin-antitoxin system VapC family toxin n=1 Tax=Paenibacillus oryzisoli TaxID=1850517 RepID=UPI003D28D872